MPSFKLPRGWYRERITELVDVTLPPVLGPLTRESAWRYVYACALWAEPKDGVLYPHLNDRLAKASGRALAARGTAYLTEHLTPVPGADPFPVIDHVGRAYAAERVAQGFGAPARRDPNVTGAAFEVTLQVLLDRLAGVTTAREPELRTLSGFELAPDGYHSRPDLALFSPADFRLLISTKWTLRKERIGTYLHEAYFYKQRRPDLQVAFVVSEFNTNILSWLANDPLVDRVYHVNMPMLLAVHSPFPRVANDAAVPKARLLEDSKTVRDYHRWLALRERVFDLSQLFADVEQLRPDQRPLVEPEEVAEGAEDADEDDGL